VSAENNGYLDARLSIIKKRRREKEKKEIHPRCSQIKFQKREDNSRRKKELGSHPFYYTHFIHLIHCIHFIFHLPSYILSTTPYTCTT
jgi:hypothetical protein